MKIKQEIELYLNIVIIGWGTYAIILTPIMFANFNYCIVEPICIHGIGMSFNQWVSWLWQGAIVDLGVAYLVGKLIIWRKHSIVERWSK